MKTNTGTMTKKEKIESLESAMTHSMRDDGVRFYHFASDAPATLQRVYLDHYEVRDLDYQIFNEACDIVSEIYESDPTQEEAEQEIYEQASDTASIYTEDRLAYLNVFNEEDISDTMREYGIRSIADACAIWYDRQVEQAAILINEWINE